MMFSVEEIERYGRQILVPGWGAEGQERLRAAKVVVRGTGAAAEAAILYLAGAGVGEIEAQRSLDEARALNSFVKVHGTGTGSGNAVEIAGDGFAIAAGQDRFAVGAAVAVETLKALLGMPHSSTVEVP